jgi:type I restriction enzyme, S subunit
MNMETAQEWHETTLRELVERGEYEIRNNLRQPLSGEQRAKMQGGYPYYGAASAIDRVNDYRFDGLHLLVAEDGTVTADGKSPMLQLVSGKFWVSNHAHVLRGRNDHATRRLYYFLRGVDINPYITGAVQPKLSKSNLLNVMFPYPSTEEEKHDSVAALSALDDKIELLQQQNETLEQMAHSMFDEWFPVNAEGEPMMLGDFVEHLKEQISPHSTPKEIYYHYSIPAFDNAKKPVREIGALILSNKYRVQANTVLFSKLNPSTPRVWVVLTTQENAVCSTEFQVLKPKDASTLPFIYALLRYSMYARTLSGSVQGTSSSHQRLRPNDILSMRFPRPDPDLLARYDAVIYPILKKIEDNESQARLLSSMRDTLLPRLVSGETRVRK